MLKKNLSIIIVVMLTLVLIAIVIWLFNKRIENIDGKTKPAISKTNALIFQQSKQL